eukprot:4582576-Ditylum_brightwellii.AAC.1
MGLIGDFSTFKTVWYHPGGIANIFSLANMKEDHQVAYNSQHGNCFTAEQKDGTLRSFGQSEHGLYYSTMNDNEYILVNIVAQN